MESLVSWSCSWYDKGVMEVVGSWGVVVSVSVVGGDFDGGYGGIGVVFGVFVLLLLNMFPMSQQNDLEGGSHCRR